MKFSWDDRHRDFDILSRPAPLFDNSPIKSVHSAGDTKESELKQAQQLEKEIWSSKVVVDNTIQRNHRCLVETELQTRGPKSSNQLTKLEGLLKDEPKKYSLRQKGMALEKLPSLSVVAHPSLDRTLNDGMQVRLNNQVKTKHCGYNPGLHMNEGLLLDRNRIPIRDAEHALFERLKGHDFR